MPEEELNSIDFNLPAEPAGNQKILGGKKRKNAKAFIRYVVNSLHPSDYTRTDVWIQRMKYWLDHGIEELYFFMHMHDEATSPELTVYLVDKMNKECGLNLIKPKLIENGGTDISRQKGLVD